MAESCLIDVDHEDEPVVVCGEFREVDEDLLVVAVALPREVVAHMMHGMAAVQEMAEVDDVLGMAERAVLQEEAGGIAVDGLRRFMRDGMEDAVEEAFASLRLLHGIPAEADADVREGITSGLAEGDFLPLDEVDGHGKHSFFI